MFKNFFNKFLSPNQAQPPASGDPAGDERLLGDDRLLALQAENQQLKLALEQAQAQTRRLQDNLARQKESAAAGQAAAVRAGTAALLTELARPAAQFLTQIYLAEQGKTLHPQDALAVARRMLRVLQNAGVEIREAVNTQTEYNPDCHQALSADAAQAPLQPGQAVLVRTPGLVLRQPGADPSQTELRLVKAGVEAAPQTADPIAPGDA